MQRYANDLTRRNPTPELEELDATVLRKSPGQSDLPKPSLVTKNGVDESYGEAQIKSCPPASIETIETFKRDQSHGSVVPIEILDDDEGDEQVVSDDEPQSDEEFPELLAAARERRRVQELAKERTKAEKEQSSHTDVFFESQPNPHDAVLLVLVTSWIKDTKPVKVRVRFTQSLGVVRLGWCQEQTNAMGQPWSSVESSKIFLTYNMRRQYDSSTCADTGLKLDHDGNVQGETTLTKPHFEAWTEAAFQEFIASRQEDAAQAREKTPPVVEESSKEETIRIILRSQTHPDFKLTVRPSTLLQKIIDAFYNKHGITEDKEVILRWDGDTLDPGGTVADADLEDMDSVEVLVR